MTTLNEKPLSVNDAWKGKRYKTNEYKAYQTKLLWLLPKKIIIPDPPFEIYFKFGFSSTLSDWDNPVKPLQDILAEKYGFNDKLIKRGVVDTEIVPKGKEFFQFELKTFTPINKIDSDLLLALKMVEEIRIKIEKIYPNKENVNDLLLEIKNNDGLQLKFQHHENKTPKKNT